MDKVKVNFKSLSLAAAVLRDNGCTFDIMLPDGRKFIERTKKPVWDEELFKDIVEDSQDKQFTFDLSDYVKFEIQSFIATLRNRATKAWGAENFEIKFNVPTRMAVLTRN